MKALDKNREQWKSDLYKNPFKVCYSDMLLERCTDCLALRKSKKPYNIYCKKADYERAVGVSKNTVIHHIQLGLVVVEGKLVNLELTLDRLLIYNELQKERKRGVHNLQCAHKKNEHRVVRLLVKIFSLYLPKDIIDVIIDTLVNGCAHDRKLNQILEFTNRVLKW